MSHEKRTGVPMKGGAEYDALTGWKRYRIFKPGERKESKASYNRRVRRNTNIEDQEPPCTPPPTST